MIYSTPLCLPEFLELTHNFFNCFSLFFSFFDFHYLKMLGMLNISSHSRSHRPPHTKHTRYTQIIRVALEANMNVTYEHQHCSWELYFMHDFSQIYQTYQYIATKSEVIHPCDSWYWRCIWSLIDHSEEPDDEEWHSMQTHACTLVVSNSLVDPVAQVGHSGIHGRGMHVAVRGAPGDNTHKIPHPTVLTDQRATWVTLKWHNHVFLIDF